jgi:hypothetical protein
MIHDAPLRYTIWARRAVSAARTPAEAGRGRRVRGVEIDRPDVVAGVAQVFARYETALVANDLAVLDELFWEDERTVRVGFDATQVGHAAVVADRRARDRQTLPRRLRLVAITTFGPAMATVTAEFVPDGSDAVGRQSQTWVRFEEGWRVVSAHVSWKDGRAPR